MLDDIAKERLQVLARGVWQKGPTWRSRQLRLTQEERDYLARYLRWERSLKRVETSDGSAMFRGRPDAEFPWSRVILSEPSYSQWGYLRPRGFSRRLGA